MQTIHKSNAVDFIVTFCVTLLVITFVMSIGVAFRFTNMLARDLSWDFVAKIFLYGLPPAFGVAIPVSVLMSCLLMFGRVSADGEITAIRACGISLWRAITPILLISAFLMLVCLYLNSDIGPRWHYEQRKIVAEHSYDILKIIEPGKFVEDIPGHVFYVGGKRGNTFLDVKIYTLDDHGRVKNEIRARKGVFEEKEGMTNIVLHLTDCRIDPKSGGKPIFFDECPVELPAEMAGVPHKKDADMTLWELADAMKHDKVFFRGLPRKVRKEREMKLNVEMNKRLCLSAACFTFAMLGIPLGIKTSRRESSVGVLVSLLLVAIFYLFVILADSLSHIPEAQPHAIVWLPVVISFALGIYLINRANH